MAAMYQKDTAKISELVAKLSRDRAPLLALIGTMCEMILEEQIPDWEQRTAQGQVMMPKFLHRPTDQVQSSDEVPTHVARAGQLVAAVGAKDEKMFLALYESCAAQGEEFLRLVVGQIVSCATRALNAMKDRS
jgi:hypothetical protein